MASSESPALAVDEFPDRVHVTDLPIDVVLTGSASAVTGVRYEVTDGPAGAAENTAPVGDWSTWRATITLPTTGTFQVTIVASGSDGGTRTVSTSVELHL